MIILINKNLNLELLKGSHSKELFELTDYNRTFLKKWLSWVDFTITEKDTLNFIERSKKKFDANNGMEFIIKYNGKIVGEIGLVEIGKFERRTEIGYWLAENYNGKGIMTKSCRALAEYCFNTLNLTRIIIRCDVKNNPSRGVPERLGFFKQGILKRDGFENGVYVNHVQYSIRKKEWY
ncbi:MAG: GNAT family protein, partial [bacterium]